MWACATRGQEQVILRVLPSGRARSQRERARACFFCCDATAQLGHCAWISLCGAGHRLCRHPCTAGMPRERCSACRKRRTVSSLVVGELPCGRFLALPWRPWVLITRNAPGVRSLALVAVHDQRLRASERERFAFWARTIVTANVRGRVSFVAMPLHSWGIAHASNFWRSFSFLQFLVSV